MFSFFLSEGFRDLIPKVESGERAVMIFSLLLHVMFFRKVELLNYYFEKHLVCVLKKKLFSLDTCQ